MRLGGLTRGPVVGLAAVVLAVLVSQVAFAGGSDKGTRATASAVTTAKFKKLKKQVAALQEQVDTLSRQPGPQGPPGPAGTAPACEGNASGDTMVSAGAVCIDRFEASIWDAPEGGNQISGAIPCNVNGQDCNNIFARSVPGVTPRANITWFQAQQALANVGKRLPTNAEWQQAVAGTPDSSECNVSTLAVAAAGANASCISRFGASDMVGNLTEWVADWDEQAVGCAHWVAGFGSDLTCLGRGSGEASTRFPGALLRGGNYVYGADAGPFVVDGGGLPSAPNVGVGFRGAR